LDDKLALNLPSILVSPLCALFAETGLLPISKHFAACLSDNPSHSNIDNQTSAVMPSTNENSSSHDPDKEKDKGADHSLKESKGGKSKASAASKAKDLSHVPCKFFRVGSCTAGASCPFSHTVAEAGAAKDVCTWFVKGNCKFAHKCALAHILPGQSMAMDRKNKKAAQASAAGGGGGGGGGGSKDAAQRGGKPQRRDAGSGLKNPLMSGSTAPTRILQGTSRSSMPMPVKATLSPSAPAPPLKDTEFGHFGLPDDDNADDISRTEPAPSKSPESADKPKSIDWSTDEISNEAPNPPSPSGALAMATKRPGISHLSRPSNDFGPIGSPTRSVTSGASVPRTNGFSPGTSPSQKPHISSPFSAPGGQTTFGATDQPSSPPADSEKKYRSGIAASLGANQPRAWNTDLGPVPSQVSNRIASRMKPPIEAFEAGNSAVDDGDLEDFLPSSLNDLLTPEERSRRLSRSHSGQPASSTTHREINAPQAHLVPMNPNAEGNSSNLHRYSRSVPAPSLLGDIRSIWSDRSGVSHASGLPSSPDRVGLSIGGAPGSYKSMSGLGPQSLTDDNNHLNPSLLSPSNASAAFLPGFHQHYKHGSNLRPALSTQNSSSGAPPGLSKFQPSVTFNPASQLHATLGHGTSHSQPFNMPSNSYVSNLSSGRPISGAAHPSFGLNAEIHGETISPSARALQSHAPGQSLPQGLAAGYSRIHAMPPANLPSPGIGGSFGSGYGTSIGTGLSGDWKSQLEAHISTETKSNNAPPGLDNMFSRLSYTASTSPQGLPSVPGTNPVQPMPSRTVSGGRQWGTLSPLSRPTNADDDELFSFDG
jgi:hypothetical protein